MKLPAPALPLFPQIIVTGRSADVPVEQNSSPDRLSGSSPEQVLTVAALFLGPPPPNFELKQAPVISSALTAARILVRLPAEPVHAAPAGLAAG